MDRTALKGCKITVIKYHIFYIYTDWQKKRHNQNQINFIQAVISGNKASSQIWFTSPPSGGILYTMIFLKPHVLRVFRNMLACGIGSVTE